MIIELTGSLGVLDNLKTRFNQSIWSLKYLCGWPTRFAYPACFNLLGDRWHRRHTSAERKTRGESIYERNMASSFLLRAFLTADRSRDQAKKSMQSAKIIKNMSRRGWWKYPVCHNYWEVTSSFWKQRQPNFNIETKTANKGNWTKRIASKTKGTFLVCPTLSSICVSFHF